MKIRNIGGKRIGSVAVDSQTGVEHYQVPKRVSSEGRAEEAVPSSAAAPPHGITPGYGKKKAGQLQNLAGVPAEFMRLFEHDPSEVILRQALKHPVGIVVIYTLTIVVAIAVIMGSIIFFSDSTLMGSSSTSEGARALGLLVTLFIVALVAILGFAATIVYKKSRLILTNQKLVFIRYHSLFSRSVSQLNISEVQDVSVAQHSIWDRLFKMGSITVETAGEQNNYIFTHVDKPHKFAHMTIQAHEGSIAEYGN